MREEFEQALKNGVEKYGKGGVTVTTLYGDKVSIDMTADSPAGLIFGEVWVEDVGGLDEVILLAKKYGVRILRR